MNDSINILILSCGTRNKVVQYFKRELGDRGQIIATDCSELAPALYEADKHFIVPKLSDENYLNVILNICKENNIKGVFSLIDPELSFLAKHKIKFLEVGTFPIISDYDLVEKCFDKYLFFKYLSQNGFKTIKSYIDIEVFLNDLNKGLIKFPVFVKPVKGSASINISKVSSLDELKILFNKYNDLMIQEFIEGTEYGVDVYIDLLTGKVISIFAKEKIKMRAGETDKSVSVKDEGLFDLVRSYVEFSGFRGVIDLDIFKTNNEYCISEVNPRFGGGYPHAFECSVNFPKMIINNLLNFENKVEIGEYLEGVYMMKYNEIKILQSGN